MWEWLKAITYYIPTNGKDGWLNFENDSLLQRFSTIPKRHCFGYFCTITGRIEFCMSRFRSRWEYVSSQLILLHFSRYCQGAVRSGNSSEAAGVVHWKSLEAPKEDGFGSAQLGLVWQNAGGKHRVLWCSLGLKLDWSSHSSSDLQCQEISNTLWAFGKQKIAHKELFEAHWERISGWIQRMWMGSWQALGWSAFDLVWQARIKPKEHRGARGANLDRLRCNELNCIGAMCMPWYRTSGLMWFAPVFPCWSSRTWKQKLLALDYSIYSHNRQHHVCGNLPSTSIY